MKRSPELGNVSPTRLSKYSQPRKALRIFAGALLTCSAIASALAAEAASTRLENGFHFPWGTPAREIAESGLPLKARQVSREPGGRGEKWLEFSLDAKSVDELDAQLLIPTELVQEATFIVSPGKGLRTVRLELTVQASEKDVVRILEKYFGTPPVHEEENSDGYGADIYSWGEEKPIGATLRSWASITGHGGTTLTYTRAIAPPMADDPEPASQVAEIDDLELVFLPKPESLPAHVTSGTDVAFSSNFTEAVTHWGRILEKQNAEPIRLDCKEPELLETDVGELELLVTARASGDLFAYAFGDKEALSDRRIDYFRIIPKNPQTHPLFFASIESDTSKNAVVEVKLHTNPEQILPPKHAHWAEGILSRLQKTIRSFPKPMPYTKTRDDPLTYRVTYASSSWHDQSGEERSYQVDISDLPDEGRIRLRFILHEGKGPLPDGLAAKARKRLKSEPMSWETTAQILNFELTSSLALTGLVPADIPPKELHEIIWRTAKKLDAVKQEVGP